MVSSEDILDKLENAILSVRSKILLKIFSYRIKSKDDDRYVIFVLFWNVIIESFASPPDR